MAKKKTATAEEIAQERLASTLKDLRDGFIPEPTRTFNIGDHVSIGALDNVKVTAVLDGGKIIQVVYDHIQREGSRTPSSFGNVGAWMWTDVHHYRTLEENKKIPSFKTSMHDMYQKFRFYQSTVDSLVFKAYKNGVEMNTEYQRPLVWTLEQKQALIESLFNGVDIGKVVFIKLPYSVWGNGGKGYEILDGKQRLSTILEFMEDRFTYKGKKFSELSFQDQYTIENHPLMYAEVDAERITKKDIYAYFLVLNVAGVPQSEEHLAKVRALYEALSKE